MTLLYDFLATQENIIIAINFIGGYLYLNYLRSNYTPSFRSDKLTQIDIVILSGIFALSIFGLATLLIVPIVESLEFSLTMPHSGKLSLYTATLCTVVIGICMGYKRNVDRSFLTKWAKNKSSRRFLLSIILLWVGIDLLVTLPILILEILDLGNLFVFLDVYGSPIEAYPYVFVNMLPLAIVATLVYEFLFLVVKYSFDID